MKPAPKTYPEVMYEMGKKFLLKGYDIIADNTNLSTKSWDKWNEVAKKVGNCRVVEKHFDTNITLKELFVRNKNRDRKVPEDVITECTWNGQSTLKTQKPIAEIDFYNTIDLFTGNDIYDLQKQLLLI